MKSTKLHEVVRLVLPSRSLFLSGTPLATCERLWSFSVLSNDCVLTGECVLSTDSVPAGMSFPRPSDDG